MISVPDFQSAAKEFRAGKIDIKAFTNLVFGDLEIKPAPVPKPKLKSNPASDGNAKSSTDVNGSVAEKPRPKKISQPVQSTNKVDLIAGDGLCLDEDRINRCGFSEVIFGEGKTENQIQKAARKLLSKNQDVLVTRLEPEMGERIVYHFPTGVYHPAARTLRVSAIGKTKSAGSIGFLKDDIAIVCAGTSDQRVGLEAQETLAWMGIGSQLIMDVGVAGPTRLTPHLPALKNCKVVIVAAGMDGALASVVGGHLPCPVISVPTSVGYGAAFEGVAPLLSMLNSCASNVIPVNIDAGFKAAYVSGVILRQVYSNIEK